MKTPARIFEETYRHYLAQLDRQRLAKLEFLPEVRLQAEGLFVPLFGRPYRISADGIMDAQGASPGFDICVILCKYVLLFPDTAPDVTEWVSFRGLKDSGPLTTYFANDVEKAIAARFTGQLDRLRTACSRMGGYPPMVKASYDLCIQFDALPRIPVILLFNDAENDPENFWPATCSLLFESRAETYLDPECLAMTGRLLASWLKKAAAMSRQAMSKVNDSAGYHER